MKRDDAVKLLEPAATQKEDVILAGPCAVATGPLPSGRVGVFAGLPV